MTASVYAGAADPYLPPRGEPPPRDDPYRLGRGDESQAPGHGAGGPADKRIVVGYGFWVFLLSDCIMFAAFFAAHAVLHGATADGPDASELFDLRYVAGETGLLLASSFFCGMAAIALQARSQLGFQAMMAVTFAFGAGFLGMEVHEFMQLVERGAGPSRSAFLSSYFTLVGCHGGHVFAGSLWCLTTMAQVLAKGFTPAMERRFMCFALFWHALDIVWVGVFTLVYLLGVVA